MLLFSLITSSNYYFYYLFCASTSSNNCCILTLLLYLIVSSLMANYCVKDMVIVCSLLFWVLIWYWMSCFINESYFANFLTNKYVDYILCILYALCFCVYFILMFVSCNFDYNFLLIVYNYFDSILRLLRLFSSLCV